MKKQLLIAAIAATVSAGSFADISIKGDAHLRYAYKDNDTANTTENSTGQRVRLHVTGKSGDTTVKLGLRNDGNTRVSAGAFSDGAPTEGSGRGITAVTDVNAAGAIKKGSIATLATDYLFLTTKIGALNIKVGDWWDTSGLGLVRKGQANPDQVEISTKIGAWKVSLETGAGDSNVVLGAEAKVAGWSLDFEHDTTDDAGYTDIAVKGKVGEVGVAAEIYNSDSDADANVVHLWTKVSGVTWHIARANWDADQKVQVAPAVPAVVAAAAVAAIPEVIGKPAVLDGAGNIVTAAVDPVVGVPGKAAVVAVAAKPIRNTIVDGGNRANNSKFSPLGVSILGTAPGINGNLAIGNVNASNQGDTTVVGIRADAKVAGMGIQVAIGNLEIGATDDSFNDIIVTRPLGKGSNVKFSTGEWNDTRTTGVKVSVKF